MKPYFNRYIEQSSPQALYQCGTYRYKFGIFPTVTRKMLLPNDMHSSGLFISGCDCSQRYEFTANYVKTLLVGNARVIYITDRIRSEHDVAQFCRLFEVESQTKNGAQFIEMTDTLDVQPLADGAKILVLKTGDLFSSASEGDPNLLSTLKSIAEAKLTAMFGDPFVVVIDDMGQSTAKPELLPEALKQLGGYDECAGLIISTSHPQRYKDAQQSFCHYALFKLCDATEFQSYFHIFRRNSLKKSAHNLICAQFCNSQDMLNLEPDHFNYTRSRIGEWVFDIKLPQK